MKKVLRSLAVLVAAIGLTFSGAQVASAGTLAIYTNSCTSGPLCYATAPHPSAGAVTVKINVTGTSTATIPWTLNVGGTTYCSGNVRPVDATYTQSCSVPGGTATLGAAVTGGSETQLTIQY